MNFTVDKENKKVLVERKFKAPLNKVWSAWTESHLLDKWWAPKPWKAETKSMDFKDGGFWLYAMVGPEGEKHWARADYTLIEILKGFSVLDAFCDEEGNINTDFPRSSWVNKFSDLSNETIVTCEIKYNKLEDLEKIIELGFREGFTMALENLDQVLS
ncbi:MAG: SRPBCC domain-containing protein [Candidatus Sericytochromatia bacterium]